MLSQLQLYFGHFDRDFNLLKNGFDKNGGFEVKFTFYMFGQKVFNIVIRLLFLHKNTVLHLFYFVLDIIFV